MYSILGSLGLSVQAVLKAIIQKGSAMISRLRGLVLHKDFEGVVVDVHGIGFRVSIPMTSLEKVPGRGDEVELFTKMVVREDAMDLYGFCDEASRRVFSKLIGVSGIGPRLAMSFLSSMTSEGIVRAVLQGDLRSLTSVKGVGKKTAERLVLEVKDAFSKMDLGGSVVMAPGSGRSGTPVGALADLHSALVNLGYQTAMADKAVAAVSDEGGAGQNFNAMLRAALKVLRS
jgi:Holliday junction DNA helicase RuvA